MAHIWELGLPAPAIAWHASRDGLAEVASFLGVLTGALGKVATDVMLLRLCSEQDLVGLWYGEGYQPTWDTEAEWLVDRLREGLK